MVNFSCAAKQWECNKANKRSTITTITNNNNEMWRNYRKSYFALCGSGKWKLQWCSLIVVVEESRLGSLVPRMMPELVLAKWPFTIGGTIRGAFGIFVIYKIKLQKVLLVQSTMKSQSIMRSERRCARSYPSGLILRQLFVRFMLKDNVIFPSIFPDKN